MAPAEGTRADRTAAPTASAAAMVCATPPAASRARPAGATARAAVTGCARAERTVQTAAPTALAAAMDCAKNPVASRPGPAPPIVPAATGCARAEKAVATVRMTVGSIRAAMIRAAGTHAAAIRCAAASLPESVSEYILDVRMDLLQPIYRRIGRRQSPGEVSQRSPNGTERLPVDSEPSPPGTGRFPTGSGKPHRRGRTPPSRCGTLARESRRLPRESRPTPRSEPPAEAGRRPPGRTVQCPGGEMRGEGGAVAVPPAGLPGRRYAPGGVSATGHPGAEPIPIGTQTGREPELGRKVGRKRLRWKRFWCEAARLLRYTCPRGDSFDFPPGGGWEVS